MTDDELAELLRSVIARPDDHDSLRVYADCLIERGDLRGELIVVQLQRRFADSPELAAREGEVMERLDAALATQLGQPGLACAWHRGFLEAADFTPVAERTALADTLRQLGTLPSARQLRRIVIRFIEPGWGPLGSVIAALTKVAPQLRMLRELVFTMSPRDDVGISRTPSNFGDLSQLCRAIPKLEVLEVGGADYATLRDLQVPNLKRLVLEHAPSACLAQTATVWMPVLEELEIHGGNWRMQDFERWLARELPLRHLVFVTGDIEALQLLSRNVPAAPLFQRVRTFTLAGAPLDKNCVDYLVHHAAHLRRLKRFEIDATPHLRRLVEALGDIVVVR